MVCAKSDMEIARLYVTLLGGDEALFSELADEHARVVRALTAIRDSASLLEQDASLARTIALRDPYADPLSLLQIRFMQADRELEATHPDRAVIELALGTTMNGIAQAMRNTG
jgi:phosphoenolpyruvate carboxylase